MVVRTIVKRNTYYDSLTLMRLQNEMRKRPGVKDAVIMMGTDENKRSVGDLSLMTDDLKRAKPNDLVLVIAAETAEQAEDAMGFVSTELAGGRESQRPGNELSVRSLDSALRIQPDSNLAVLSIPGRYVKREALKALEAGLNLLVFSDNVPVDDEIELKQMARRRGLLVMGPDCGTAIIGGAALGFANAVRRGHIGLVGASGTGLQEVSCLIHRLGHGVSHAIGTGTRDVREEVGGVTMLEGLKRLEEDPDTRVIVIVSKPPDEAVVKKVLESVRSFKKPVVVNFLGSDSRACGNDGVFARTLEGAAVKAVAALTGEGEETVRAKLWAEAGDLPSAAHAAQEDLVPKQKYVRGLFSGGTFTSEAALILSEMTEDVYTNTNVPCARPLPDSHRSARHTCLDLGADLFTAGRPHPMLEPRMRRERLLKEAEDPETAVLLFDVVLGYGAHPDPAGRLADYVREAREVAEADGRYLVVVSSVCGVMEDPQGRTSQVRELLEADMIVMPSNALATRLAALIALNSP